MGDLPLERGSGKRSAIRFKNMVEVSLGTHTNVSVDHGMRPQGTSASFTMVSEM